MAASPVPNRPTWARRLDRWTLRMARWLSPVVGRPSDRLLTRLARAARPSPPIRVPTAEELGIVDHLGEGRRALSAGLYAEALAHFTCVLEAPANGDAGWAWHGRGDALQLMGQHLDALAAYERAVQLHPKRGIHRLGCANALEALGREAEAREATIQGLALDPSLTWMRPRPTSR